MRQIKTQLNVQLFPSGVCDVYRVANIAEKGDAPQYKLSSLHTIPFEARTLGDVRYYAAMQADSKISRVIRIPKVGGIQPSGDLVTLTDDPGRQYRIARVAENTKTLPESMDLTLEVAKTSYDTTGV